MMKRLFGAVALLCALAGMLQAQNNSTFGNISTSGAGCGPMANCVYYQLPSNTAWVVVQVAGTWSGSLNIVSISAPNANYSNLNTVPWTTVATETANGTWTVATSGATYLLVTAPSWTSGTAQVTMTQSPLISPLINPVFPGSVTAGSFLCNGVPCSASAGGANAQIQYNNGGALAGSQATLDSAGNLKTPGAVATAQNVGPAAGAMPHWRSQLSKVKYGTGNARLCAVGDSTTFGGGTTAGNLIANSYPTQLAALLNTTYGYKTSWSACFGTGATTSGCHNSDLRQVTGSDWAQDTSRLSLGGGTLRATTNGGTNGGQVSITTLDTVDTFRLFYVVDSGQGTFTANIDGGTATLQSTSGTQGVGVLTLTAGAVAAHTLNYAWSSGGAVNIIGWDAYDSTSHKVIVENMGSFGTIASQLADRTHAYGGGFSAPYQAVGCDLAITADGINDWAVGTSIPTFTTQMQNLITAEMGGGSDVALYSEIPSATSVASQATQSTYVEALRGLTLTNNNANTATGTPLPYIDNWTAWGSYVNSSGNGWMSDTKHANAKGYGINAQAAGSTVVSPTDQPNQGLVSYPTGNVFNERIAASNGSDTTTANDYTVFVCNSNNSGNASTTGTWSIGANSMTVASSTGIVVGQLIQATGIPNALTVSSVVGTTVSWVGAVATGTGSATAVSFLQAETIGSGFPAGTVQVIQNRCGFSVAIAGNGSGNVPSTLGSGASMIIAQGTPPFWYVIAQGQVGGGVALSQGGLSTTSYCGSDANAFTTWPNTCWANSSTANTPSATNYMIGNITLGGAGPSVLQTAIDSVGNFWTRVDWTGSWSAWTQYAPIVNLAAYCSDLNTNTTAPFQCYANTSTTNTPVASTAYLVANVAVGGVANNYVYQIAIDSTSGLTWHRLRTAGAWGTWRSEPYGVDKNNVYLTNWHQVFYNVTLSSGTGTLTITSAAAFTSASTYSCTAEDRTTPANTVTKAYTNGTTVALTGTGTDVIWGVCSGY
jgi:hypothetical protein